MDPAGQNIPASAWQNIPADTYVIIKHTKGNIPDVENRGYVVKITDGEAEFYFKKFGKIKINFKITTKNITAIATIDPPAKIVKGGGGGNAGNRQLITRYMDECQTIKNQVGVLAAKINTEPDRNKVYATPESLSALSTDMDKRLHAANQQLRRILDTVDSRFATHTENVKVIVAEFKTISARISKLELSVDSINTRISRINEWVRKHN